MCVLNTKTRGGHAILIIFFLWLNISKKYDSGKPIFQKESTNNFPLQFCSDKILRVDVIFESRSGKQFKLNIIDYSFVPKPRTKAMPFFKFTYEKAQTATTFSSFQNTHTHRHLALDKLVKRIILNEFHVIVC